MSLSLYSSRACLAVVLPLFLFCKTLNERFGCIKQKDTKKPKKKNNLWNLCLYNWRAYVIQVLQSVEWHDFSVH